MAFERPQVKKIAPAKVRRVADLRRSASGLKT
jgi:hypothetical protein